MAQTTYTADPAPMVYKDKLYVYTGHDADGATYFEMPDYQLFSTSDMQNWENHGTILSAEDFKWAEAGSAWASQCIERNGKFYFYEETRLNYCWIGNVGITCQHDGTGMASKLWRCDAAGILLGLL